MKIQTINNYTNTPKFKGNTTQDSSIINCSMDEYISSDKTKRVQFKLNKLDIFNFINSILASKGFFKNINPNEKIDVTLNIRDNTQKPQTLQPKKTDIPAEIKRKPVIQNDEYPFPNPPFKSNPTEEQKQEYVNVLLKYIQDGCPSKEKAKAIEIITEYGDKVDKENLYKLEACMSSEDEDVIKAALQYFKKWGDEGNIGIVMFPIRNPKYTSLTGKSEIYTQILKTVQKLANLQDYTPKERERIFYEPISNLLNHTDERVRKIAQETLDKISIE